MPETAPVSLFQLSGCHHKTTIGLNQIKPEKYCSKDYGSHSQWPAFSQHYYPFCQKCSLVYSGLWILLIELSGILIGKFLQRICHWLRQFLNQIRTVNEEINPARVDLAILWISSWINTNLRSRERSGDWQNA